MKASRPPAERRLQPKMSLRYPDGALGCGSDSRSFPIFSEQQPRSQTGHRICQSTEPVRWRTSLQRISGRTLSFWSPLGTYKPVPLSITAAVELPVVTSMLHGSATSLLLGDEPYDLPFRGEIELFLLYYAVVFSHNDAIINPLFWRTSALAALLCPLRICIPGSRCIRCGRSRKFVPSLTVPRPRSGC